MHYHIVLRKNGAPTITTEADGRADLAQKVWQAMNLPETDCDEVNVISCEDHKHENHAMVARLEDVWVGGLGTCERLGLNPGTVREMEKMPPALLARLAGETSNASASLLALGQAIGEMFSRALNGEGQGKKKKGAKATITVHQLEVPRARPTAPERPSSVAADIVNQLLAEVGLKPTPVAKKPWKEPALQTIKLPRSKSLKPRAKARVAKKNAAKKTRRK